MLASSRLLSLAGALVTGAWLARSSLAQVSCNPGELVNRKECVQAISQIVYETPKHTLDRWSTRFAKLSGNCTIIVLNSNKGVVTKQQIEAGFTSVLDQCTPQTGQVSLPNGLTLQSQDHQSEHDTQYFPPRSLTCGLNTNAPLSVEKDCQEAYNSIPVDSLGRLAGKKLEPTPSIVVTFQTCTVLVYTTDSSSLIAKKRELQTVFSNAIKECKGKSAVTSSPKGGSGINGLTVLKVRSSKRCGSRSDSEGQVCN